MNASRIVSRATTTSAGSPSEASRLSGIGSIALSTVLNVGLFWVGFRVLTAREVGWRQLRGGAVAAGVLYELLQVLGGYYVGHTLKHASDV